MEDYPSVKVLLGSNRIQLFNEVSFIIGVFRIGLDVLISHGLNHNIKYYLRRFLVGVRILWLLSMSRFLNYDERIECSRAGDETCYQRAWANEWWL